MNFCAALSPVKKLRRKPWDIAYASREDKIFPVENLRRVWGDSLRVCEGEHLSPAALRACNRRGFGAGVGDGAGLRAAH